MVKHVERNFAGRTLKLEAGRLAKQAAGSCLVQFGETVVLAAVTVSDNVSTLPFFPLTVEYREKSYAAGKIPGGFLKREGRPQDEEILSARVTDRSIRPLFPEGFKNEVQVFIYVLSADQENDADVLGVTAASAALTMSQVPWNGPIAAVRVGRVEGAWILNPTFQQLEFSDVDLTVSGSRDSIVMVEGGALELTEAEIIKALEVAHKGIKELLDIADEVVEAVRQPKMEWVKAELPADLVARVTALAEDKVTEALTLAVKAERTQALSAIKSTIVEQLAEEFPDKLREIAEVIEGIEYDTMRDRVLTAGERVDGRDLDTVRPITCEVGWLPRTHGSALFTRGQTQALASVTLGTTDDEQRIDRRRTGNHEVVHAALQLPPLLDRGGEAGARHVTPRDRSRSTRRAGITGGAAAVRAVPVYHPHRLRNPRIQWLVLDGHGVQRLPGFDGCRSPGEIGLRGCRDGSDYRRRTHRHPHRHPRNRRSSRRHGLQGCWHAGRRHLDPDGHQRRRLGPGHDRRRRRGRRARARHGVRHRAGAGSGEGVRRRREEHDGVRRLRRDHSRRRRIAAHLGAAARPHREDGRCGQERRPFEGEAARGRRARSHAIVPEGSTREELAWPPWPPWPPR